MKCKARQYSDQMVCHDCSLVWDMNDPDRPACNLKPESAEVRAKECVTYHNSEEKPKDETK